MKLFQCVLALSLLSISHTLVYAKDESSLLTEVNEDLVVTESLEGAIKIEWVEPKGFSDIRRSNGFPNSKQYRHFVLEELHEQFEELVQTLPDDYSMHVKVTNVDMAGDTRIGGINEIRILRQIDIPRMYFSYEVKDASGQVVSSDEVKVQDMNYLQTVTRVRRNEALFYEKSMLTKWFKREFKSLRELNS